MGFLVGGLDYLIFLIIIIFGFLVGSKGLKAAGRLPGTQAMARCLSFGTGSAAGLWLWTGGLGFFFPPGRGGGLLPSVRWPGLIWGQGVTSCACVG